VSSTNTLVSPSSSQNPAQRSDTRPKVHRQHNGTLKSPFPPHNLRCTTDAITPASDLAPPLHIIGSLFALSHSHIGSQIASATCTPCETNRTSILASSARRPRTTGLPKRSRAPHFQQNQGRAGAGETRGTLRRLHGRRWEPAYRWRGYSGAPITSQQGNDSDMRAPTPMFSRTTAPRHTDCCTSAMHVILICGEAMHKPSHKQLVTGSTLTNCITGPRHFGGLWLHVRDSD
jgi:hypothetical protein